MDIAVSDLTPPSAIPSGMPTNATEALKYLRVAAVSLPPPIDVIAALTAASAQKVLEWTNDFVDQNIHAADPFLDAAYKPATYGALTASFKTTISDGFKDWLGRKQYQNFSNGLGMAIRNAAKAANIDVDNRARTANRLYMAAKNAGAPEFMAAAAAGSAAWVSSSDGAYHQFAEIVHKAAWGSVSGKAGDGRELAISKDYPVALAAWKKGLSTTVKQQAPAPIASKTVRDYSPDGDGTKDKWGHALRWIHGKKGPQYDYQQAKLFSSGLWVDTEDDNGKGAEDVYQDGQAHIGTVIAERQGLPPPAAQEPAAVALDHPSEKKPLTTGEKVAIGAAVVVGAKLAGLL